MIQTPITKDSDQNETANPDGLPDDKSVSFDETSGFDGIS